MSSSRSVLIGLVVAAVGAIISYNLGDWGIFERFGSLITVVGILFFGFGFRHELEAAAERYQTNKLKRLVSEAVAPGSTEEMRKWINISETIYDDAHEAVREAVMAAVKRREIFVLVFGTLIWGWGSYLGRCEILSNPVVVAAQHEQSKQRTLKCMAIMREAKHPDDALALKLLDAGCMLK